MDITILAIDDDLAVLEVITELLKPWGDGTLELQFPDRDPDPLISALNMVYLPARFTGLWHRDTKDLEFIWTPLVRPSALTTRVFDFRFGGRSYRCE